MTSVLLVLLVLLLVIGSTLWAFIDAQLQPEYSWRDTRTSKGVTNAILLLGCGLGAIYYFALVRPRLVRSQNRGRPTP